MSPRASAWGFAEGDEIAPGRWAVRLLGGGVRYEAYVAWDDDLHALVVVRVLRPARVDDPGARAGLAGEAAMLGRLAHLVIVRSFGADLDGPRPHVVLEHLDGPRLSTLIRRHGVVTEQLLPPALQMCSALHHMSARGVVYLDVKPKNIIMSGPPRLIDLSVARPLDRLGDPTGPVGTEAYMAPEQCHPGRFDRLGPPADVWGPGVTLYEALSGAKPFPPETAEERFPQLRAAPAVPGSPSRARPGRRGRARLPRPGPRRPTGGRRGRRRAGAGPLPSGRPRPDEADDVARARMGERTLIPVSPPLSPPPTVGCVQRGGRCEMGLGRLAVIGLAGRGGAGRDPHRGRAVGSRIGRRGDGRRPRAAQER